MNGQLGIINHRLDQIERQLAGRRTSPVVAALWGVLRDEVHAAAAALTEGQLETAIAALADAVELRRAYVEGPDACGDCASDPDGTCDAHQAEAIRTAMYETLARELREQREDG